ncbi:MAG: hypothetical protein Q8Q33_03120 [Chlamydiota bacterium]|nr:hypothetical protein [Chlamydiota bacterium]
MKNLSLFLCVFCFICVPITYGNCAETEPQTSVLDDVIGSFESPNLNTLLQAMDLYAKSTGESVEKGKEIFFTLFFKNPGWKNIDLNQPILYLFLDPEHFSNPFLYLIHTNNIDLYLSSFGESLLSNEPFLLLPNKHPHQIREYLDKQVQFDRKAFLKALKSGQDFNPDNFNTVLTKNYYVYLKDDTIMVSGDLDILIKIINDPSLLVNFRHPDADLSFSYVPTLLINFLQHTYGSFSKILETDFLNKDISEDVRKMIFQLYTSEQYIDVYVRVEAAEQSKLNPLIDASILSLISQESISRILEGTMFSNMTITTASADPLQASQLRVIKKNDSTPHPINYYFIENIHIFSQTPLDPSHLQIIQERFNQAGRGVSIYFVIPINTIMQTLLKEKQKDISQ